MNESKGNSVDIRQIQEALIHEVDPVEWTDPYYKHQN